MRICLIIFTLNCVYGQPDSIVKVFSTDLMRTDILNGNPKESINKNDAHFRAVYYSSGELKRVEFVPASWDKGKREKIKPTNKLKLYYKKWNPRKQELLQGISKKEAVGIPHYRATLDEKGLVQMVDYFNRHNKAMWTFHMHWDDEQKSSKYDIEFYSSRNLSELNQEMFAPELSTIRPGWKARYKYDQMGKTRSVKVMDSHENLYYYYLYQYGEDILQSQYFRSDSVLVGSHKVQFNQNKKPIRITYYNENGTMKNAVGYEYSNDVQIVISQYDHRGKLVERRIIPKKESN